VSNFGKRVDGPAGRRGVQRQEVTLLGSAMTLGGANSVIVEDLSSTGARVIGRCLPAVGEEILIRTDRVHLFGRVAWARNDYRGILFEDARN
jgi:hypothetical protein